MRLLPIMALIRESPDRPASNAHILVEQFKVQIFA
jgi:hypothetical protein